MWILKLLLACTWLHGSVVDATVSRFIEAGYSADERDIEEWLLQGMEFCEFLPNTNPYKYGCVIVLGMYAPSHSDPSFPMQNPTSARFLTQVGDQAGLDWVDLMPYAPLSRSGDFGSDKQVGLNNFLDTSLGDTYVTDLGGRLIQFANNAIDSQGFATIYVGGVVCSTAWRALVTKGTFRIVGRLPIPQDIFVVSFLSSAGVTQYVMVLMGPHMSAHLMDHGKSMLMWRTATTVAKVLQSAGQALKKLITNGLADVKAMATLVMVNLDEDIQVQLQGRIECCKLLEQDNEAAGWFDSSLKHLRLKKL